MSAPKVLVLRAPGINCERETHFAFARAGGAPEFVHITELLQKPDRLFDYRILAVPGGVVTCGIASIAVWIWSIVEAITVTHDAKGRLMR